MIYRIFLQSVRFHLIVFIASAIVISNRGVGGCVFAREDKIMDAQSMFKSAYENSQDVLSANNQQTKGFKCTVGIPLGVKTIVKVAYRKSGMAKVEFRDGNGLPFFLISSRGMWYFSAMENKLYLTHKCPKFEFCMNFGPEGLKLIFGPSTKVEKSHIEIDIASLMKLYLDEGRINFIGKETICDKEVYIIEAERAKGERKSIGTFWIYDKLFLPHKIVIRSSKEGDKVTTISFEDIEYNILVDKEEFSLPFDIAREKGLRIEEVVTLKECQAVEDYMSVISGVIRDLAKVSEKEQKTIGKEISAREHYNSGWTHMLKGEYGNAINELRKAVEIDPNFVEANNAIGCAYAKKGDYDNAIEEFKKAIKIDPDYAKARYNLGKAYFRKGLYYNAIKEYRKAIESKPDYANAHYDLGFAYLASKEKKAYDLAEHEFKEYLKYAPNAPNAGKVRMAINEIHKRQRQKDEEN